jgi:hypothetical protein
MQVLCHNLFDLQSFGRVGEPAWERGLQKSIADLGNAVFRHWINQASAGEKRVLRKLAAHAYGAATRDLRESGSLGKEHERPDAINSCLGRLSRKQLVRRVERGRYLIPDPLFREFILSFL